MLDKVHREDRRARRAREATSACTDTSPRANQGAQFVRHLENMLVLARVIAQGARNRDESRGAHYKPAFPKRDDDELAAHHAARTHESVGAVEVRARVRLPVRRARRCTSPTRSTSSLVKPRARKYEQAGAASAAATGKLRRPQER